MKSFFDLRYNGKEISTVSVSGKGNLFLPVPDFSEEVVAIITK